MIVSVCQPARGIMLAIIARCAETLVSQSIPAAKNHLVTLVSNWTCTCSRHVQKNAHNTRRRRYSSKQRQNYHNIGIINTTLNGGHIQQIELCGVHLSKMNLNTRAPTKRKIRRSSSWLGGGEGTEHAAEQNSSPV